MLKVSSTFLLVIYGLFFCRADFFLIGIELQIYADLQQTFFKEKPFQNTLSQTNLKETNKLMDAQNDRYYKERREREGKNLRVRKKFPMDISGSTHPDWRRWFGFIIMQRRTNMCRY